MPSDPRRQLWIVAGPNGAGKSTLVSRRLKGRLPVVNPDVYNCRRLTRRTKALPPWAETALGNAGL